jgi:hypothetical protein
MYGILGILSNEKHWKEEKQLNEQMKEGREVEPSM